MVVLEATIPIMTKEKAQILSIQNKSISTKLKADDISTIGNESQ